MATSTWSTYNTRLANRTYWGQQDYEKAKKERKEKAEMEKTSFEEETPTSPPQPSKYQIAKEKNKGEYVKNTHSIVNKAMTSTPPKNTKIPGSKDKVVQKDPEYVEKWKKNHQITSPTQPKVNKVGQDVLQKSSNTPTPSDEIKDNVSTTNE